MCGNKLKFHPNRVGQQKNKKPVECLVPLFWLPCGIWVFEFQKGNIWRPVLQGSESGSDGLVDPLFTKPPFQILLCVVFLKKIKKYYKGV